jgi:hypothetical protein
MRRSVLRVKPIDGSRALSVTNVTRHLISWKCRRKALRGSKSTSGKKGARTAPPTFRAARAACADAARTAAGIAGFGLPQRHLKIRPPLHQASLGASEYRVLPLQRRQHFRRHHLEGVVRDLIDRDTYEMHFRHRANRSK